MFHFFGRMRGNGRKAAPDYRLLDYADHLRFIRPFVQARYGSEPAQEILSILKDSADDEWTYSRSRKALQPLTGRSDAEFLARVELMASEAIGGVNSAIGAANECGTRMERRLQVFAPDGMKPCASCRMLDGLRTGLDEPFTLPGGIGACSGDAWLPIDPMVPECLSEESACTVVELFEGYVKLLVRFVKSAVGDTTYQIC